MRESLIIAADDLSPSETVQMDKSKILSIVTQKGAVTSHTAILARTMGIPAIIGLGDALSEALNGAEAIVDGHTGALYIWPDEQTESIMRNKQENNRKTRERLERLKGKPNVTLDGREIEVFANIGSPDDLAMVLRNDAGGIGLFRSEFLYLDKNTCPSEDEQFAAYKTVLETMAGKLVVIRTLDIGADKRADYLDLKKEENPALGMRAIRLCLTRPEMFVTQLRALYRASAYGKLAIMFPMIVSVEEVERIQAITKQVRESLTRDGIPFSKEVKLGVMVETPAAAIISDRLAKIVDFFSVGTNDLTQYTLAIDRQNLELEPFRDARHEAVLRLIRMAADNARKAGIWIGICGELAGDLTLTQEFIRMGIDELSVSPPLILPLREKIRNISVLRPS
jgi:phosphotransferase system enzyme I (PtsI)